MSYGVRAIQSRQLRCYLPKDIAIRYKDGGGKERELKPGKIFEIYCRVINYYASKRRNLLIFFPIENFYYIPLFALSLYYFYLERKNVGQSQILVISGKYKHLEKLYQNIFHTSSKHYVKYFANIKFTCRLPIVNGNYNAIVIDTANFSSLQLRKILEYCQDIDKFLLFVSSFFDINLYQFVREKLDIGFFAINPNVIREYIKENERELLIIDNNILDVPIDVFIKNFYEKIKIEFVNDESINNLLTRCWKNYYYILDKYKGDKRIYKFIMFYRFTLRYLSQVYLPSSLLEKYSSFYSNIKSPDKLIEQLLRISSELDENILESSALDIKRLAELIEAGKKRVFEKIIKQLAKTGRKVLIVVHSLNEGKAVKELLCTLFGCDEKEIKKYGIEVHIMRAIFNINNIYDWVIFPTPTYHYKSFSLISSPLIKNVIFLAYPIEYKYYLKFIESLDKEWKKYTIEESLRPFIDNKHLEKLKKHHITIKTFSRNEDIKKIYETWDDIIKEILSEDEEPLINLENDYRKVVVPLGIKQYLVKFENGVELVYDENERIDVIDENYKIKTKHASEIKPGDLVIIYDQEFRKNRYESLIEKLKEEPKYKRHLINIDIWKRRVAELLEDKNLAEVLTKMKKKGSRLQHPSTLYAWKMGYVIGPRDPKDIQRIAELFNDEVLKTLWKDIAISIKRIRGFNIEAGKILSRTIKEISEGIFMTQPQIQKEDVLGITVAEIAQNIDILRVISKEIIKEE